MDHSPPRPSHFPFDFHGEKRLRSQDRIWIVTDVHSYTSRLYHWSVPQEWFRVGALDLDSNHLMLVEFSRDDARQLLRAGLPPPPWNEPLSHGLELTRIYHGDQEKGRFREKVALIDLDPELLKHGPMLRKHFESQMGLRGNSTPGMWEEMVEWARRQNAIESAALSFDGWFSAGDVKKIVGNDIHVSATLKRMVKDGLLVTNGRSKRGARYMKAPPRLVERADWVG